MTTSSERFRTVAGLSPSELEASMRRGERPDPGTLAGSEFRGANTARWTSWLRMQQFIKGFEREPDGRLFGYNRRVEQDGLDGQWSSRSERFGFFEVREVDPQARDNLYLQALLLDYGAGHNQWFDPSRLLRDYLVRDEQGSDDLLVGRAFLTIGSLRPSPTYFVLERLAP
jgi:hypothetical protein